MPQSSIIIVAIIPRPDRMGALNELNIRLERVSPAILYVCSLVSTQQSGNFLIKTIESLRSHTHHHIVSYQCNARIGIVRTQSTFAPHVNQTYHTNVSALDTSRASRTLYMNHGQSRKYYTHSYHTAHISEYVWIVLELNSDTIVALLSVIVWCAIRLVMFEVCSTVFN